MDGGSSLIAIMLAVTAALHSGLEQQQAGKHDEAVKAFTQVVAHARSPEALREQALFYRARSLVELKQPEAARADIYAAVMTSTDRDLLQAAIPLYQDCGGDPKQLPLPGSALRAWYAFLRHCADEDFPAVMAIVTGDQLKQQQAAAQVGKMDPFLLKLAALRQPLEATVSAVTSRDDGGGAAQFLFSGRPQGADGEELRVKVVLQRIQYQWRIADVQADGNRGDGVELRVVDGDIALVQEQQNMQRLANAIRIRRGNVVREPVLAVPEAPPAEAMTEAAAPPPLTAEQRARIDELVRDLGSMEPEARQAARRELEAMGPAAKPDLQKHRDHDDPEIRLSVRELLER